MNADTRATPVHPLSVLVATSYQGYDYATVLIGEQCWFAENLRVQSYSNGEALINGIGYDEAGAYSEYVAFLGNGIWQSMLECCGLHYNAYAVLDSRNLCLMGGTYLQMKSSFNWKFLLE